MSVAVPRGTIPRDERKYESASPVVGHCSDRHSSCNWSLANEAFEEFFRGQETGLVGHAGGCPLFTLSSSHVGEIVISYAIVCTHSVERLKQDVPIRFRHLFFYV